MTQPQANGIFRVALTADFYNPDGSGRYPDFGVSILDEAPSIAYQTIDEHRDEIGSEQISAANGVIVLTPSVTARTVAGNANLLAIGRFGVGYDGVDVPACTAADVLVFITPGAVDRPVAEATVCWMLALSHHVRAKDRLVREGKWDARADYVGRELRDRTLGIVGLGRIGRAVVELLQGFGMNTPLVFDPFISEEDCQALGVKKVELDQLMADSDFVSLHCLLNDKTRDLIGRRELELMKPDAYLINIARGGIVNEEALFDVLQRERIAGAAIDCFVGEPIVEPHRFGQLDNVLLAPHAIAVTQELFRDIGRAACTGMVDLAAGREPRGVVNPEVLERPGFQEKWARLQAGN